MKESTNYIAIFGAVTGGISLLINVLNYLRTRAKLRIKLKFKKPGYYIYAPYEEWPFTGFQSKSIAYQPIEFHNLSQFPITIKRITIKTRPFKFEYDMASEFTLDKRHVTFNTNSYDIDYYEAIESQQLPYRIDSFDAKKFGLYFPFFEDFLNDTSISNPVLLKIYTTRKTYYRILRLTELKTLHEGSMLVQKS